MQKIIETLKNGGTILYPTDTIWGIGCDATNVEAIKKVAKIKNRNDAKSFIILVENERRLQDLVEVPEMAWEIIDVSEKPVTIIYEKARNLPQELLAKDGSIAIRLVKDKLCKRIIGKLNQPLVSTSANLSGEKSPVQFSDISPKIISQVDVVVEEHQDKKSKYSASSIIKIYQDNRVEVIRE